MKRSKRLEGFVLGQAAVVKDDGMNLDDTVTGVLRAGYQHQSQRSLVATVFSCLRRLVEEGRLVMEEYESERRYYLPPTTATLMPPANPSTFSKAG